jgi:hypothetical protein
MPYTGIMRMRCRYSFSTMIRLSLCYQFFFVYSSKVASIPRRCKRAASFASPSWVRSLVLEPPTIRRRLGSTTCCFVCSARVRGTWPSSPRNTLVSMTWSRRIAGISPRCWETALRIPPSRWTCRPVAPSLMGGPSLHFALNRDIRPCRSRSRSDPAVAKPTPHTYVFHLNQQCLKRSNLLL